MSTKVKMTEPKIEYRPDQPYIGIRTQVPMSKFKKAIPQHTEEVFAWLHRRGVAPAGAPFIRYHVINMSGPMDIELGVPVASAIQGDDRVSAGVLPAGRYASLIYTGVSHGIKGNKTLLEWGAAQGLRWDRWDEPHGDAFGGRYESFLTSPEEEPDTAKWDTEVAIRLADE
jgi:effector-binding domain-containing protein